MPKVNPHADPTRRDLGPAALGRTVKKLFSYYPVLAPVTFVCILFSSIVSSVPSLFTQNIIQIIEKWYVSRDWAAAKAEIVPYLTLLVVLYALSILSMTVYTQLMAYMTQGFLHKLRCEMFGGMQKLPIRYFDSHQHGDIMSHYTNDIDTLRQLVSQALPALIQSGAIVLVVFSIMLYFSLWLTLVLVLGIIAMVAVTKKIGGGSAKYFVRQQKAVASTEGFIQEMMAGQKVVKVFCHEQKSIEDFDRLNDALFEDSFRAQAYASVLGPIIGNIGNILYVTLALVGGVFLLIGLPNVSLTGTVMENIRYGRLDATDEECRAAARLAGADDFITRLPHGYDTLLTNNGANLSQGQRQLIAIARAAVADPPVMILDEATSSIDTRTEAIVQRGMDQLMEGRTVFVIAHRLSTVKNSDVIMVLDHGRIIERGSHEKLIAERGTYYQLYTGAFELE